MKKGKKWRFLFHVHRECVYYKMSKENQIRIVADGAQDVLNTKVVKVVKLYCNIYLNNKK